jgi:hypothetical protein
MNYSRTTIMAGIAGVSLMAIIAAFRTVQTPGTSEEKAKAESQAPQGKSACDVGNGRAALLAQKSKAAHYDLGKLLSNNELIAVNREVSRSSDKAFSAVSVNEKAGEGVVWIKGVAFSKGTIELDLRGKDVFQKSFIGIAFHGADDKTFDGIYFRPFNFKAADSTRRAHAVQYISHPDFPWKKLREERKGEYEKAVAPVPDPDNWFHATIEVGEKDVKVYVNNARQPSLVVNKLNDRTSGSIGLWTGEGSGGEFANLTITQ